MSGSAIYNTGIGYFRGGTISAAWTVEISTIIPTIIPYGTNYTEGGNQLVGSEDTLVGTSGNSAIVGAKQILATITGIDATATGVTLLYTVPTGRRVFTTEVILRVGTATSVTVPATLGVGVAAGEDDIVSPTALTNLLLVGQQYTLDVAGLARIANAGDSINLGIDTGATATAQTLEVLLVGIEV